MKLYHSLFTQPLLLKEQLINTKDSVSCKKCHKYNFAKVKDMLNAYHATLRHTNSIT